jgi:aspartyl protease
MASTCPPRANFLPLFSFHCPHDLPRGISEIAGSEFAANTTDNGSGSANDTLSVANTPTTANSVGLDIQANDVGYIATIQMGTPPRDFKLLMDSGSADFWVGAEGCKSVTGGDCVSSFLDSFSPLPTCSSSLWCRATMYFLDHNPRLHLRLHKIPSK